jgi:hypothetical protein
MKQEPIETDAASLLIKAINKAIENAEKLKFSNKFAEAENVRLQQAIRDIGGQIIRDLQTLICLGREHH